MDGMTHFYKHALFWCLYMAQTDAVMMVLFDYHYKNVLSYSDFYSLMRIVRQLVNNELTKESRQSILVVVVK
jgi:hypothetical protein